MTREFIKGSGPACPHCGNIMSKRMNNGWSEPEDYYLRYKQCLNCNEKFTTAEVVIPPDKTTFYRLDGEGRRYRREYWRTHYAKVGNRLRGKQRKSDELHITVRVVPFVKGPSTECMRGHPFTPENTYQKKNGWRGCRTCRQVGMHSYYLGRKTEWNAKRDAK